MARKEESSFKHTEPSHDPHSPWESGGSHSSRYTDQNSKEDYALIMELLGTPAMRRLMRQLRAQIRQREAEASASAHSSHNEVEPDPEAGHTAWGSNDTPALTSHGSRVRSWVKRRLLSWQDRIRKRKREDIYKSSEHDPEFHMQGYSSATNTVVVVAALIATLSFAALLQPPGGIRQEGSLGKANLAGNLDFKVFFIANGMALFVALLSILILTSVVPRSHYGAFLLYPQGRILVWVATIFTVIAFTSAAYIVAGPGHRILAWLLLGGAVLLIVALFAIVGAVKLDRKIFRPMREDRKRNLRRSQAMRNPQKLLHGQEDRKG